MALTLLKALSLDPAEPPLAGLEVSPEAAARALAFEARLFRAVARYGVRGASR